MKTFLHKKVYITGGSSGIGLETAKQLTSLGAHVVIFARIREKLEAAKAEINGQRKGINQIIKAVQMDVADNDKVDSIVRQTVEDFGAPDVLIANAGVGYGDLFENISYDTFDNVMKINVYGVRNTIAALLPAMKKDGGKIVIVSSLAGLTGMYSYSAYATSKFALVGFAQSLRPELKKYKIDVTLICPPEVETPFVQKEAKTLPKEARAIKDMAGVMKVEDAGKAVVKAVAGKKFLCIPGFKAKSSYFMIRFLPEKLIHATVDAILKKVSPS